MAGCALLIGFYLFCPTYPAFIAPRRADDTDPRPGGAGRNLADRRRGFKPPTLFYRPFGYPGLCGAGIYGAGHRGLRGQPKRCSQSATPNRFYWELEAFTSAAVVLPSQGTALVRVDVVFAERPVCPCSIVLCFWLTHLRFLAQASIKSIST